MRARVIAILAVLLGLSCSGELTVQSYAGLLAERLEAASRGDDPDEVLRRAGVEEEEYARFELDVFSDPELAGRVLGILRRDHPELFSPEAEVQEDAR